MAKSPPTGIPQLTLTQDAGRSHRYDADENPAFSPPSTSNTFQIFDSSEVFKKNPRKFDLLSGGSQDDSKVKKNPTLDIVKSTAKTRSRSMAVLGSQTSDDYKKMLSEHANHPAMAGKKPTAAATADTLKPAQPPAGGPGGRRRTSVAIMERSSMSPSLGGTAGGQPQSKTAEDIGGLGKMFRAAFGSGTAKAPNLPGYLAEEDENKSEVTKPPEFKSVPTEAEPEFVPVTVTPEPRRLFGFGPQYQPPSETVMMPKDQASGSAGVAAAGGSLLDKVKLGGFTAIDTPGMADGNKRRFGQSILKPPTGEEMNTWAPFST